MSEVEIWELKARLGGVRGRMKGIYVKYFGNKGLVKDLMKMRNLGRDEKMIEEAMRRRREESEGEKGRKGESAKEEGRGEDE